MYLFVGRGNMHSRSLVEPRRRQLVGLRTATPRFQRRPRRCRLRDSTEGRQVQLRARETRLRRVEWRVPLCFSCLFSILPKYLVIFQRVFLSNQMRRMHGSIFKVRFIETRMNASNDLIVLTNLFAIVSIFPSSNSCTRVCTFALYSYLYYDVIVAVFVKMLHFLPFNDLS